MDLALLVPIKLHVARKDGWETFNLLLPTEIMEMEPKERCALLGRLFNTHALVWEPG